MWNIKRRITMEDNRMNVKLMDLAKIVVDMKISDTINFANCDMDEVDRIGGWIGIRCVDFFDNDNIMYVIGHWGGEANAKLYHISEYDDRIGSFCEGQQTKSNKWSCSYMTEQNYINCVGKMIADYLLNCDGYVNEVLTVEFAE